MKKETQGCTSERITLLDVLPQPLHRHCQSGVCVCVYAERTHTSREMREREREKEEDGHIVRRVSRASSLCGGESVNQSCSLLL